LKETPAGDDGRHSDEDDREPEPEGGVADQEAQAAGEPTREGERRRRDDDAEEHEPQTPLRARRLARRVEVRRRVLLHHRVARVR
jgi:hypothetical protein